MNFVFDQNELTITSTKPIQISLVTYIIPLCMSHSFIPSPFSNNKELDYIELNSLNYQNHRHDVEEDPSLADVFPKTPVRLRLRQ